MRLIGITPYTRITPFPLSFSACQPFVAICITFHCFLWCLTFTTQFWILTIVRKKAFENIAATSIFCSFHNVFYPSQHKFQGLKTRAVIIQSISMVIAFNRYYTICIAVSIELRCGQPFVATCLTFLCFLWCLAFPTQSRILTTIRKKAFEKLLQPSFCMQSNSH